MNSIDTVFSNLKIKKKCGLIPYFTAGYPSLKDTARLIKGVAEKGIADIVEIGLPFSDPVADGATIQESSKVALDNGVNTDSIFEMIEGLNKRVDTPIVLMTYFNPVYKYGIEKFFRRAGKAGIKGIIIADLPVEDDIRIAEVSKKYDINTIYLVTPTSSNARVKKIASLSSGFIYFVSRSGTTGARANLPAKIKAFSKLIKSYTDKPVAIGFGVSTPEHIKQVAANFDAAIVGSAIIDSIKKNIHNDYIGKTIKFINSLYKAL